MESLVFRWQHNADTHHTVEWITVDADGRPHISTKTGSLDDLARQLRSQTQKKQPIFLLSADYYSLHEVTLPPKLSVSNVRKAAPYAIEDELVDSIDQYHFACGNIVKSDSATTAHLAAINKNTFTNLLATLNEYQIKPRYVYPENLLLPEATTANSTIFVENEAIYTRLDNGLAHTLPLDLLATLVDDIDDDRSIKIISQQELDSPFTMDNIEYELMDRSLLSIFAKQLHQQKPFDLLQGEFKYQEELGKHLKPWRWPFALAGIALLVVFISQLITVNQLNTQNLALQDEKVAIYKQAFPRSRNIDVYSVRTRMEQAVKKAGGNTANSSAFIPLLEKYSKVTNDNITINSIDFSKDKLSLIVIAKDIQLLDQVKVNLEKSQHVVASILSSKSVDSGIEATLKLELR